MKKMLLISALAALITGCSLVKSDSRLYEVRMMNGDTLYARSKPKLDSDNYYRFNDINKQRYILNKNLVLYIEPSSVQR